MPNPLVLGFDTSAAHCAAVLLCGDKALAAAHEDMTKGQAERLMPLLQEILDEAGVTWQDLDGLGVGIGPGNFTGIRIAVSAARGLALSLGIPAVGVSSLEAQAFGVSGVVVSSLDARRGGLYLQVFGNGSSDPMLCDLTTLPTIPAGAGPICLGHNTIEIAALYAGHPGTPATPIAEAVARIAKSRMHNPALERPAPLYLRGADAAPPRDSATVMLP